MSGRKKKAAADPRALKVSARSPEYPLQFGVENAFPHLPDTGSWDDFYVNFSGYFGSYGPHVFKAAPDLLAIAERILDRGYVSKHIGEEHDDHMQLVAAIARARGEV